MTSVTPVCTPRRSPAQALDSWVAAPRWALGRALAWVAVNFVLALLATVVGYLLMAAPPLSWLPSADPLNLADHLLGALVYGGFGWPLHLAVVAFVSRSRRARLWAVLSTPLLSIMTFGLIYWVALWGSSTGQSVALSFTLYGVVCRLYPYRSTTPTA